MLWKNSLLTGPPELEAPVGRAPPGPRCLDTLVNSGGRLGVGVTGVEVAGSSREPSGEELTWND